MVTLRSRKVLSSPPPKSESTPEPVTPAQTRELFTRQSPPSHHRQSGCSDSTRRQSLRLASKSVPSDQNEKGSSKRKRMSSVEEAKNSIEEHQNGAFQVTTDVTLNLRSGKSVVKRLVEHNNNDTNTNTVSEVKGKGKLSEQLEENELESNNESVNLMRYSREEKGKRKLDDYNDGDGNADCDVHSKGLELESKVKDLVDSLSNNVVVATESERKTNNNANTKQNSGSGRMDRFHDIARRNASRFAHFEQQEQVGERLPDVVVEMPSAEENNIAEDWPGPFSTAMKIIRDRAKKLNLQKQEKAESVVISWVPRTRQGLNWSRARVPSLQELCLLIIVKNIDAVSSLDHVPDALRHRICQMLCECRRMNPCFMDLLVCGSPAEIRVKDCSWMSEEEFMKCFEGCDTSNLMVLQLDQCGRCIPDYVLPTTLARSSRSLPVLISLSLCGACRLSDIGLSSLVSSAVALRSINLSQCSLLTSASIDTLADSLGPVLQELYIDDCQNLDAMLILPAMKKLEHLEVLSLAGNQTVCDDFMREFLVACGHNIKELGLANCTKLTDSSLKVIAETCPRICALDLSNLRKLTDSALGYLANGCREIQTLKLCRNAFSDEGLAAYVESSGEFLKELSLNNVKNVGHHTAISVARRSRNLISLDLSWCRNLKDEAVGLIVDSCSSLKVLKLFGCGQITNVFLDSHSNPEVKIIGLKMSQILEHIWVPDSQEFPLRYSPVPL